MLYGSSLIRAGCKGASVLRFVSAMRQCKPFLTRCLFCFPGFVCLYGNVSWHVK